MKKIILKKINLLNFKGVRQLSIDFNEGLTVISGCNGLGKTTVFDAFIWLLFGKDSKDRKTFDIKTLDTEGNVIPRLPHEVSATLFVDGQELELCRRFKEKWVKHKGQTEEVFDGNVEERIYNNVPLSMKEWNEKISQICPEQVFKFITNPNCFSEQKAEVQRNIILRMAGNVSDADIASSREDFRELLSALTGKSLEEYKREIQAKKRKVKDEIDGIPSRIDERQRSISAMEVHNFEKAEAELAEKQSRLEEIEAELLDRSKKREVLNAERESLAAEIGTAKERKMRIESRIVEEAYKEYNDIKVKKSGMSLDRMRFEQSIKESERLLEKSRQNIKVLEDSRESLLKKREEIENETIRIGEDNFICPTCHRKYDLDEIKLREQEITAEFNKRKADRLMENTASGQEIRTRIDYEQTKLAELGETLEKLHAGLARLNEESANLKSLEEPDTKTFIMRDAEWKSVTEEIQRLEDRLAGYTLSENSDLIERKMQTLGEINALREVLYNKEIIKDGRKRIAELEASFKDGVQKLAELERMEFTIAEYNKARIDAVEEKVNKIFSIVRFKMLEKQINGGEVETCEAMVNGVPYSSLNSAGRICAGLDIISAICKFEGITAPIFVDNAESVNTFPELESQMILLYVSEDRKLTVK